MSGALEKISDFGNKYAGIANVFQFALPLILGMVLWAGTLYLDTQYQKRSDALEENKAKDAQFTVIQNQLQTIIQGQIAMEGRFKTIDTILNNYSNQFSSTDERLRYLERQKKE